MTAQLLREIEAYLIHTDMAHSTFGKMADGNPGLVVNLRKGQQSSPRKQIKIRAWMNKYPEGPPNLRRHPSRNKPPQPPQPDVGQASAVLAAAVITGTLSTDELVGQTFEASTSTTVQHYSAKNPVPTPALSATPELADIIRLEAFKQRKPLAAFLADLVRMGWECYQEGA